MKSGSILMLLGMTLAVTSVSLSGGIADAGAKMRNRPGPPSFAMIDANGDGYITKSEFETFRRKRMEMMAAQGRPMRNAGRGMSFSALDTDGDGRISRKEFAVHRAMHRNRKRR